MVAGNSMGGQPSGATPRCSRRTRTALRPSARMMLPLALRAAGCRRADRSRRAAEQGQGGRWARARPYARWTPPRGRDLVADPARVRGGQQPQAPPHPAPAEDPSSRRASCGIPRRLWVGRDRHRRRARRGPVAAHRSASEASRGSRRGSRESSAQRSRFHLAPDEGRLHPWIRIDRLRRIE